MNYKEFSEQVKKKKQDLLDRMSKSYQKNKRKDKIEKLQSNPDHWEGVELKKMGPSNLQKWVHPSPLLGSFLSKKMPLVPQDPKGQ